MTAPPQRQYGKDSALALNQPTDVLVANAAQYCNVFVDQRGALRSLLDFADSCWGVGFQAHPKFDAFTSRHTVVETAVRFQLFLQIDLQLRPTNAALGCDHLFKVTGILEIEYRPMAAFRAG